MCALSTLFSVSAEDSRGEFLAPPAISAGPRVVAPFNQRDVVPANYREVVVDRTLPDYDFPYSDGLYATVAGYLGVKSVSIKHLNSFDLEIESFEKKMPVKAVIQKHSAPLVVVLLGIGGTTGNDFSKLWASWYAESGCHVLMFDSTFRPEFVNISGHGVSGNLWKESERIAQIIQTFSQEKKIRGMITQIGIVGMSYGGSQALILGRLANEGKLPFQIAAIQAYSPPIRFEKTAEIIDRWYDEERSKYTLVELKDSFAWHKPSGSDGAPPFSQSLMRAAFSASFRIGLPDVIVRNDEYYKLSVLPHGNEFDDQYVRKDAAETWGYTRFAFDMAVPYWEERMGRDALQKLILETSLPELLQHQPPYSETILADDDPLNAPEDISLLKSRTGTARLTLLPRGGHLGYVSNPWTKAKLLTLFPSGGVRDASISYERD